MKIALLAPIAETVPPTTYGGAELVVYNLAEGLHKRGHDVTLFATGDSKVSCRLIPIAPKAVGSDDEMTRDALIMKSVADALPMLQKEKFDIIHNHTGWLALLLKTMIDYPMVTTIHGIYGKREKRMYGEFKRHPYISISMAQRKTAPLLRYAANIYHGIEIDKFKPAYTTPKKDEYLAFLGRFSYVKGPLEAIKIAKATGMKLKMAGIVNEFERDYFEKEIKPLIDGKQIIHMGPVGHEEKVKLLRGAKALLSPIHWEEPFGLVNVEAMACGTPVIAMKRGSLPELIVQGKTGYVCRSLNEMIAAVGKIDKIDRKACRKHVESKFSIEKMIDAHERLFKRMITPAKKRYTPRHIVHRFLKKSK